MSALVTPHHILITVVSEVGKSLDVEKIRYFASRSDIVTGDIGNIVKPLLVVLGNSDDAIFLEERYIILRLKLSYDCIGIPL